MEIELREMDMGYRKLKKRPKPEDFGVTDFRCYFQEQGGSMVEATLETLETTDSTSPLYEKVDAGQWELMVDGVQWGYVIKKHDHISLIRNVDAATKEQIRELVSERLGELREKVSMPPDMPQDDETEVDEDDDDDDYDV